MATEGSYGRPGAFRRALTDRLSHLAETSKWTLPQLQRQIAYDRVLERLYLADDGWIVKGAVALLARDLAVRATIDVDVYRPTEVELAEAQLRAAARQDLGDWFHLDIGAGRLSTIAGAGIRLPVTAFVGATEWCTFHVDLVGSDIRPTGQPERVPPLLQIGIPDVEQHGYRAYPLVDHIADKVTAILQAYGRTRAPSTRYKDLVDLVAIVLHATVEARTQQAALESEADRRGIALPNRFSVPDRELWATGYAPEARRSLLETALTLDHALSVVAGFLNPLLERTAVGRWDPQHGRWVP